MSELTTDEASTREYTEAFLTHLQTEIDRSYAAIEQPALLDALYTLEALTHIVSLSAAHEYIFEARSRLTEFLQTRDQNTINRFIKSLSFHLNLTTVQKNEIVTSAVDMLRVKRQYLVTAMESYVLERETERRFGGSEREGRGVIGMDIPSQWELWRARTQVELTRHVEECDRPRPSVERDHSGEQRNTMERSGAGESESSIEGLSNRLRCTNLGNTELENESGSLTLGGR